MNENEVFEGEVIEAGSVPDAVELQERIRSLEDTIREYREEIEHIRADNTVLKEAIVRMQLKELGLIG